MVLPFYVIIACISPIAFIGSDVVVGILMIALSAAVATSRRLIPVTRHGLFRSVLFPLLSLLSIPACYLIFQLLPIPGISHPAWQSAAAALDVPLIGAVTLDPGITFGVLARYCAFCGLLILTMVVAMSHARAERVLAAILCSLTLTLTEFLLVRFHPTSVNNAADYFTNQAADAGFLACLGLILSSVLAVHLTGAYLKSKKGNGEGSLLWFLLGMSVSISFLSLAGLPKGPFVVALGIGFTALLLVLIVRKLGVWTGAALTATACIVVVMLAANSTSTVSTADATLRFASPALADSSAVQRMLDDLPAFGAGAGTFDELYQLYGVVDAGGARARDSTPLSAVLAIEFGKIAFWLSVLLISAAAASFLIGGVLRGRDWLYPAACGSVLCLSIALCFETPMRGHFYALALVAAILGLGLAQSRSRHVDQ
jgi:hypothetical protein